MPIPNPNDPNTNVNVNNFLNLQSLQSGDMISMNPILGLSGSQLANLGSMGNLNNINLVNNSLANQNLLYSLTDNSKIKRKVFIPKVNGVNFVGLLIGPKGTYQKRLEQQSGCKILIRGK